jgi:hypothetical protein
MKETCNEVRVGKHLSGTFLIRNGAQQGDDLLPFAFNCVAEYGMRKVQEKQAGVKTE